MTKPLTAAHMASILSLPICPVSTMCSSLSLFEIFCASHSPCSLPPPLSIWFHSELWFTLKSSVQVLLPPGILPHLPFLSGQVAIPELGISSFVALITATLSNLYDYLINMFFLVEWNSVRTGATFITVYLYYPKCFRVSETSKYVE